MGRSPDIRWPLAGPEVTDHPIRCPWLGSPRCRPGARRSPWACPLAGGETHVARLSSTWTDWRRRRRQCPPTCVSLESQCDTGDSPVHPKARPRLSSPGRPSLPSRLPGQTHVCARAHNVLPCWAWPPPPSGLQAPGYHAEFQLVSPLVWASRDGRPGLSSVLPGPLREKVPREAAPAQVEACGAKGPGTVKVSDEPTTWAQV